MKGVIWHEEDKGATFDEIDIPADLKDQADEYRAALIEAAVELDDVVLAAFFEGKEPDEATLKGLIRKAVITGAFYPVLCGSAFKNKGVQTLLDAVVDYLPSPLDVPAIKGVDHARATKSSACRATTNPLPCSPSRSWTTPLSVR